MMKKTRRGKNWNRDETGRPMNRAKTWATKDRDPKRDRRNWRNEILGVTGSVL